MNKILLGLFLLLSLTSFKANATNGDTVVVQTFTFGSPQNAWFVFPSDTVGFEKILMLYTLKCNPAQFPNCGEWDYLTNTYVYKHTGLIDSTLQTQPIYLVNGVDVDTFPYINSPAYSYSPRWDKFIVHTSSSSYSSYYLGAPTINSNHPFGSSQLKGKSQYLWKASELLAAGVTAGNLTGLGFNFQNVGTTLNKLTIKIKATTLDSLTLSNTNGTGFTTVYSKETIFVPTGTGWNTLQLTDPFNWDGVSNLIIEFTFDNSDSGIDNVIFAENTGFKSGVTTASNDRTAKFHGQTFIDVPVNPEIAAIDSFVTVCFWAYGDPTLQPMDGSSFEAVDSAGNRILNSHCPWSDSKVYWDAGATGSSYDRVSKLATSAQIKGQWNYWTFTKNCATGSMKIFINGTNFFLTSGKTKLMNGIDHFRIGKGNWNGSKAFDGRIDEFAVFNIDLPLATIQQFMNRKIDSSHPNYNNLVAYYSFDDGNYITAADGSPIPHAPATFNLGTDNPLKPASEINFGFSETSVRPNILFEKGVYVSYLDSVLVVDAVQLPPAQVISFTDTVNNVGAPVDTFYVWPTFYNQYIYDSLGNAIDSTLVPATGSFIQTHYNYYTYAPQIIRYELARYITPYGNGLSLGNGWTWTFDVSDYRSLLADSVNLSAGNWQELLDLKFVMIKGTPPRNIISIQNLWNGNFDYGFANNPIENHLQPISVSIPSNAATAVWKSRVTGHGMDTPSNCAEFCPKFHYYKVNGIQRYSKLVWRDNCDYNPLYPQGGTWVYDRSNWCPGAEVWTYDWEVTNWITPGTTASLDHDVQPYTNTGGWDYYQIEDQLVTYGAPNFTNDVAMEDIISPSTNQMWLRKNPVCSSPIVRIKNTGATTLTSATITYGLIGATPSTFTWTGSLPFMQSTNVDLPNFNWIGGATEFYAYVSSPNGTTDQYAYNDTMKSVYSYPSAAPSVFVIELKTNSAPNENSYTLRDDAGNIVFSRSGLSANTFYIDTINLANGCFKFELLDTGEDGLAWWANTAQGNGYVRFKDATSGNILYNFNSDFGGQVYKQFTVGLSSVGLQDYIMTDNTTLNVYPNPSEGFVSIDFNLTSRKDVLVEVFDVVGKRIYINPIQNVTAGAVQVDMSAYGKGIYFVTLTSSNEKLSRKLIVK